MSLQSGWDNVLDAEHGIHLLKKQFPTKKVSSAGSSLQNGLRRAEPVVLKRRSDFTEDERKSDEYRRA